MCQIRRALPLPRKFKKTPPILRLRSPARSSAQKPRILHIRSSVRSSTKKNTFYSSVRRPIRLLKNRISLIRSSVRSSVCFSVRSSVRLSVRSSVRFCLRRSVLLHLVHLSIRLFFPFFCLSGELLILPFVHQTTRILRSRSSIRSSTKKLRF